MGLLSRLFGCDPDDDEWSDGYVWASFERRHERLHFGRNDNREVVYDGEKDGVRYRYVSDETNVTTGYNGVMSIPAKAVLTVEPDELEWSEPLSEPETLYAVTPGSAKGQMVHYGDEPILVIGEAVFRELADDDPGLAHSSSARGRPRGLD